MLRSDEELSTASPRYSIRQSCETIRAVTSSVFRSFTSINLSGFTILLTGSAPRTINIVSAPSSGTVSYAGLTVTNFNTWGTWPLLQVIILFPVSHSTSGSGAAAGADRGHRRHHIHLHGGWILRTRASGGNLHQ